MNLVAMKTRTDDQLQVEKSDLSDQVRDVTFSNFVSEVVEASRSNLIIIDFYAPWCGPCKQLTPVLEKLVRGYEKGVRLARIDIDKDPQIAQQMGVQSIPAVFAFLRGQPVDGFMGSIPESQVKSWFERLIKVMPSIGLSADAKRDNIVEALAQADGCFAERDYVRAGALYNDIMKTYPDNAAAYAGLLRCMTEMGELEQAQRMLDYAPEDIASSQFMETAQAALELAQQACHAASVIEEIRTKLLDNQNDHQARFDLAMAYYAEGKREAAVEELLEIVQRDRVWNEDAARKQLIKLFEAFGFNDPLTVSTRKRLSSILFS
ncbi:MAG: co-chaperone YbbN [Alphaproteobacteria bacterium]|nr:co-chaperone YbbN [Alphaproteobacteria bacterium]